METTHAHATEQDRADESSNSPHEESSLHFFARESKLVLRWAVLIFGIATILSMIVFFPVALIPAIALLASFVLLMIAHAIEQRTMQPGDPHDETAEDQQLTRERSETEKVDPERVKQQQIEEAVERKSARMIAGIIVCVAVAALVIAGVMFGRELFIIGGFILFAYMLLVATPVWLGWLNDEAEEEAHRVEDRIGERQKP